MTQTIREQYTGNSMVECTCSEMSGTEFEQHIINNRGEWDCMEMKKSVSEQHTSKSRVAWNSFEMRQTVLSNVRVIAGANATVWSYIDSKRAT